jgi:hypothetical protein
MLRPWLHNLLCLAVFALGLAAALFIALGGSPHG